MKDLLELFWAFFRIGILTFGGGLSMLPMLKYELVEKKAWILEEDLLDCYAIGQCTPGIIAVNTATYVGYKRKGVWGGVFSTLGMVAPSLLIITTIALFLEQFMDNKWLAHALMGVRAVVCALMLNTVVTLAKKSLISPFCIILCILIFAFAMFTDVPTIALVIAAAISGICVMMISERRKNR